MMTDTQKYQAISSGYALLQSEQGYTQIKTVDKLAVLGFSTKPPAFSKILNHKKVGKEILLNVYKGICALIEKELCLSIDAEGEWQEMTNGVPQLVPLPTQEQKQGFVFHREGRLDLHEKVDLWQSAQTKIIEFGTTLNTFTEYFVGRKGSAFKLPVQKLLEQGVDIECYLLDPDWSGTHFYFDDRGISAEGGKNGEQKIRNSLRKFQIIQTEFAQYDYRGKLSVFTYRHFPFNHFLAIDPDDKQLAQMSVSNYLYGQQRADCPVINFTRASEPLLFLRYLGSLQKLTRDAKRVDFEV